MCPRPRSIRVFSSAVVALLFALLFVLLLGAITPASAQWQSLNPVSSFDRDANGITFHMARGTMQLQVCSDSIIRVRYSASEKFSEKPHYVITKQSWPATPWQMHFANDEITLTTAKLTISVHRTDGTITYRDNANQQLLLDGGRSLTPVEVNGEYTYRAESFLNIYGSPEALYGLGQHQAGVFNYRGESVDISQDNTNIAVPLLVSSKGWGVYWNNTSRSRMNNRFLHYLYLSSEVADEVDYYFLYGPELDHVVASYRELTGQAPMFGKWAYGFWQCKNRYSSQEEILAVAKKYRNSTFQWTTSSRIGSGGIARASTCLIRTILTPAPCSTPCTPKTFT